MKRIVLLLVGILLLTGCTKLNDLSYDDIVINGLESYDGYLNTKRKGYSYNLGTGLSVTNQDQYNDEISSANYNMFLYVDLVSYYNKKEFTYTKNSTSFYSQSYTAGDKSGYLEINAQENGKYLIEIMYNYAKIEVIVDECDIKSAVFDSVNILSSITYYDSIIENIIGQDVLNFSEEEFNIFKTSGNDKNVLKLFEEDDEEVLDEIPDTDLVN